MKILVLNGSPKAKSDTMRMTRSFLSGLQAQTECDVIIIDVIKKNIKPCVGCFMCWKNGDGKCVQKDDQNEILCEILKSDVIIWSFPLYCYSMPSHLKAVVDRLIPLCRLNMREENGRVSHETRFDLDVEKKRLTIAARGDATMVPADRKMRITFRGVENFTPTGDLVESVVYDRETRSVTAELKAGVFDRAKLSLEGLCRETNSDRVERCKDFLMLVKMDAVLKESLFAAIAKNGDTGEILQALMAEGASLHLLECLTELLNQ